MSCQELEINSYNLAKLIETVEAQNFESVGMKLTVKLKLSNGDLRMGEIDLPANIKRHHHRN